MEAAAIISEQGQAFPPVVAARTRELLPEIARLLKIVDDAEMDAVQYERAAVRLQGYTCELSALLMRELTTLPGIGKQKSRSLLLHPRATESTWFSQIRLRSRPDELYLAWKAALHAIHNQPEMLLGLCADANIRRATTWLLSEEPRPPRRRVFTRADIRGLRLWSLEWERERERERERGRA